MRLPVRSGVSFPCRTSLSVTGVILYVLGFHTRSPLSPLSSPSSVITNCHFAWIMGRTIPSFRQALWLEYRRWKLFRHALDKSDRKLFDETWDLTALYNSAMSYAANPIRIYPILMSMLLHKYQQLKTRRIFIKDLGSRIR
jgi:hypothetical protein